MIKIGDLVKFPSQVHRGFVGYGIYLGEDDGRDSYKSQIRVLYFTDPKVREHSIAKPIWHREYNSLKLCTEEEKLQVTLWRMEGVKYPKKESNE